MKKQITMKGIALLMLLCMLVPFVPTLMAMFATEAQAAVGNNVLIYDDFQKGTSADYADATTTCYDAVLENGQLKLSSKLPSGITNVGTYHFPYAALSGKTEVTVSFEFTLVDTDASMPSLWLTYAGTKSNANNTYNQQTYSFAGLRVSQGIEMIGQSTSSSTPHGSRDFYLSAGKKADFAYLNAGTHTMTVQLKNGVQPKVYVDGMRYGSDTLELASNTTATNIQTSTLNGLFGICLWQPGVTVAIDNFLVYEGLGNLSSTPYPSNTIGTPAGKKEILIHDDFSETYNYEYAPGTAWGSAVTATQTDGKLVLDFSKDTTAYGEYYPLPYKVPDGTEAFTVELKFQVLAPYQGSGTTKDGYPYTFYNRNDAMLTFGSSNALSADSRVYVSGVRIGDFNHANSTNSQYDYGHCNYEFWACLNDKGNFGRLWRDQDVDAETTDGSELLESGFVTGATYTLVVQAIEGGEAHAYIKEAGTPTFQTWEERRSQWDDVNQTTVLDDSKGIAGYLGFYSNQNSIMALDEITVYNGIYTPPTEKVTEYIYDDFRSPDVTNLEVYNQSWGNITQSTDSNGVLKVTNTHTANGNVVTGMTGHTLPSNTESFTAEMNFSLNVPSDVNTAMNIDIMMNFGDEFAFDLDGDTSTKEAGYWTTGFSIESGQNLEWLMYSAKTGAHGNRKAYRQTLTTHTKNVNGTVTTDTTPLKISSLAGHTWTGTLKVVTDVHTVASTLTLTYTASTTTETYTVTRLATLEAQTWMWYKATENVGWTPELVESASLPNAGLTARAYIPVYFNLHKGGKLGFYSSAGATTAALSYTDMRVEYKRTKGILEKGTVLYSEDFSSAESAQPFLDNSTSVYTTSWLDNGLLKLVSGTGANTKAYKLPIQIGDDVSGFTLRMRFAIKSLETTETGASDKTKPISAGDMMLIYGASDLTDEAGHLQYGYLAGQRMNTVSEFNGLFEYGTIRRAYRGVGSVNLGWSQTSANGAEAPDEDQFYTFVVEVENGRVFSYFDGYGKRTISFTGDYAGGNNCSLPNNYARNPSTGNYGTFANSLQGYLGFYSAFREELYIDSISIVAGTGVVADTKSVADGTVLYQNDFNNANIDDYAGQAGYTASLVDGALNLTKSSGWGNAYLMPDSWVSGATSMTFSYDFYAEKVDLTNSSIMVAYNATDSENYRYDGWRQGNGYEAFEHFGYVENGTIVGRNYRLWMKAYPYTGSTNLVAGSKAEYEKYLKDGTTTASRTKSTTTNGTTTTTTYTANLMFCDYWEHMQDENWHNMTVVITPEKVVCYIDGKRIYRTRTTSYQQAESGANTPFEWYAEGYNLDGSIKLKSDGTVYDQDIVDLQNMTPWSSGYLGFNLFQSGTKLRIDNVLCVAGTKTFSQGGIVPEEAIAGQGTLAADQIEGATMDGVFKNGTELTLGYKYGTPAATAKTRVLWDLGHLYLYTDVTDSTASSLGDKVVYYISEDGSISYQEGGAYTLTVYRNGTYSVSNPSVASGIKVAVQNTDAGYKVEVKAPLATKGVQALSMGGDIGFNYVVADTNADSVQLGWSAWRAGHGNFTFYPDSLDRLTLSLSASPTGDDTVLWPYFVFGGVALVGALGAVWVLNRKKKK